MMNKNKHTNLKDEELKIIASFSSSWRDSFSTEWLADSDIFESDMSESGDIIGGGEEGILPKEDKFSLEIYKNS